MMHDVKTHTQAENKQNNSEDIRQNNSFKILNV